MAHITTDPHRPPDDRERIDEPVTADGRDAPALARLRRIGGTGGPGGRPPWAAPDTGDRDAPRGPGDRARSGGHATTEEDVGPPRPDLMDGAEEIPWPVPPVHYGTGRAGGRDEQAELAEQAEQRDQVPLLAADRPVRTRTARLRAMLTGDEIDPGRPGLRVLLVVVVVAVAATVFLWWRARPHAQPVARPAPATPVSGGAVAASASSAPSPGAGTATPSGRPATVLVDVAGKVHHPGVVTLPKGSRVIDAIKAAGGFTSGAGAGTLNLAAKVADGQQVLVGVRPSPGTGPGATVSTGAAGAGPAGASAAGGTQVSLNTATVQQLDTLPGIGPVLAQRIIDYRTEHGEFTSADQLQDVSGIGPKTYADLRGLVQP